MMETDNLIMEIEEKISELEEMKKKEVESIQEKIETARSEEAAAEAAMKSAMMSSNLEEHEKARTEKERAGNAVKFYEERLAQLAEKRMITEKESDAVIDRLLEFEKNKSDQFLAEIKNLNEKLRDLHKDYVESIKEAEKTIRTWTGRIHANYRAEGTIYADGTNRSATPVPVHRQPFLGVPEAELLGRYLEKMPKTV